MLQECITDICTYIYDCNSLWSAVVSCDSSTVVYLVLSSPFLSPQCVSHIPRSPALAPRCWCTFAAGSPPVLCCAPAESCRAPLPSADLTRDKKGGQRFKGEERWRKRVHCMAPYFLVSLGKMKASALEHLGIISIPRWQKDNASCLQKIRCGFI